MRDSMHDHSTNRTNLDRWSRSESGSSLHSGHRGRTRLRGLRDRFRYGDARALDGLPSRDFADEPLPASVRKDFRADFNRQRGRLAEGSKVTERIHAVDRLSSLVPGVAFGCGFMSGRPGHRWMSRGSNKCWAI